jgi:hypothetical protein
MSHLTLFNAHDYTMLLSGRASVEVSESEEATLCDGTGSKSTKTTQ